MEGKQTKFRTTTKFDYLLVIIQLALSASAGYLVQTVLPTKYFYAFVGVLVVLWLFSLRKLIIKKRKKKNSAGKLFCRMLSLLMSIALAFVSIFAYKGLDVLEMITGSNEQTRVMSVVVLDESSYEVISDLEGETMGIIPTLDSDKLEEALDAIESIENTIIATIEYSGLNDLQEALLNGEVESIILNEAYRTMIDELNEDFETETRVIYQYEITEEVEATAKSVDVDSESFTVFISGIDTYGPVNTVSRSDVNMLVTVNPTTKTILMTSIPRDYYVTLASYGAKDKLTHAGLYGVQESIATLENLFSIEINYYARVNFTSLVTMVDALGGITVYNDEAFTSYNANTYYPVGNIEMDGETALEFARERYGLSGGDRSRIKNQQKVLAAMIEKMISPAIITNYSSILDAISGCFETNMTSDEITSLIQMQLNDMADWDIQQITVDGTGTTSTTCYSLSGTALYVMEPDMDTVNAATAQINAVLAGE